MPYDLNEWQPTIAHFSGHGGVRVDACASRMRGSSMYHRRRASKLSGIQLQDEQLRPRYVESRLGQMIRSAAPSARVVVLNACYTSTAAKVLRRVVDCVVGMRGAITDEAARCFAVGFYRALGNHKPVGNAVEQAVATITAKRLGTEVVPVCSTRSGVHAPSVFFP